MNKKMAFVIGNGTSRNGIDLRLLNGTTYGCNALYKEFRPDVLVATDDPISKRIQQEKYPKGNVFYTRKPFANTGAKKLRPQFANWSSGPNALQLAVYANHRDVVLLGFDFGSNNGYNNMYAGSEFYGNVNDSQVHSGNWPYQVKTIINHNPTVNFIIVTSTETTCAIGQFHNIDNVSIINKETFIKKYINSIIGVGNEFNKKSKR